MYVLHAHNDIAFLVPFSPFVCKLAKLAVLDSSSSVKF